MRSRRTEEEAAAGASLVEFALILPLFAMLLFGMITVGLALNDKQQITHATREGARYASTVPASQSFTSGTWAENVRDLIVERSVGVLESSNVCVSLVEGSGTGGTAVVSTASEPATSFSTSGTSPCLPDQTYPVTANDPGRRVQVTASEPAKIDLIVFGSYSITLHAEATARSESDS